METSSDVLRIVGQVAGIGGVSLGVLLLVFREVLRKNIFPNLGKAQAYSIIRLIVVLTFVIALMGIAAYVYVRNTDAPRHEVKFPQASVEPANLQFLALVDANRFKEAWETMATLAHQRFQYAVLEQAYIAQRTPLGVPQKRTLRSVGPVSRLADGTEGAFTVTEYVTHFQKANGPYLEDVFTVAEADQWEVFSHSVRPCAKADCP